MYNQDTQTADLVLMEEQKKLSELIDRLGSFCDSYVINQSNRIDDITLAYHNAAKENSPFHLNPRTARIPRSRCR